MSHTCALHVTHVRLSCDTHCVITLPLASTVYPNGAITDRHDEVRLNVCSLFLKDECCMDLTITEFIDAWKFITNGANYCCSVAASLVPVSVTQPSARGRVCSE